MRRALFFLLALLSVSCGEKPSGPTAPTPQNPKTTLSSTLRFMSTWAKGYQTAEWTGKPGVIFWAKAYNPTDEDWTGHPEIYVYPPGVQPTRAEEISRGRGIFSTQIDYNRMVPLDTLEDVVPAGESRESITFAPVDWNKTPQVQLWWQFVAEEPSATPSPAEAVRWREVKVELVP